MTDILDIACDESGYTGPDLLHRDQRYFAYASVVISDDEASGIIKRARATDPVQMPELKARVLMSSERGCRLVAALLADLEGRYIVSINDKLLALCGWFSNTSMSQSTKRIHGSSTARISIVLLPCIRGAG